MKPSTAIRLGLYLGAGFHCFAGAVTAGAAVWLARSSFPFWLWVAPAYAGLLIMGIGIVGCRAIPDVDLADFDPPSEDAP